MTTRTSPGVAMVVLLVMCASSQPVQGATCRMRFSLKGWSAFYESASGSADVICDNGQSTRVAIRAKGGGLTVGKTNIVNGKGTFSPVAHIGELFGSYAAAEAHAGVGKSSQAQIVTKGSVSLALSGTGHGVNLGVSFGEFVIERMEAKIEKKKSK